MRYAFENPQWLWALAAAVPLAALGLVWFRAMSGVRRWSAVVLRAVLVAILASLLAGLSTVRRSERLAVVAIVDVSESVRRFARTDNPEGGQPLDAPERARRFLDQAAGKRGPDDLLGIVAFDAGSVAVSVPTRGPVTDRTLDVRTGEGTDIAGAIRLARATLPPDAAARFVLFSDGVETSGDALAAARELAGGATKIPIDAVPISYDIAREVMVESVDAPPSAPSESVVGVRVVLNATSPSRGTLRLLHEGRQLEGASRRVELVPGRNVVVIETPLPPGRVHRFRAAYEPDPDGAGFSGDTLAENNSGESFTITPGRGSVLLVDGVSRGDRQGAGSTLAKAWERAGLDVVVVAPEATPTDMLSLQSHDLVVLENVPAEAFDNDAQQRLAAYVKDLGGGLLMVGGPDSFGAGGWRGTPIEPLLPVKLELPEKILSPESATVFVIDNSGSMSWPAAGTGRSKQQVVNEAAALAITRLERNDLIGVLIFNNDFEWVLDLKQNTEPEKSAAKVRAIGTDGGTNMGPAMEEALQALAGAKAKIKHAIVLSDGRSRGRQNLVPIARRFQEAGIRVSTIGVGEDADTDVMDQIAKIGGGTFYRVLNANILPRIFLKATRLVRQPLIREEPFQPVPLSTGSPILAGLSGFPTLNGLVLTQPRPEPTIVNAMATPQGEPLLAHWNVGLGRVGAFTSDAHDWASAWISWPGYSTFWTQAARNLSRPSQGRALQATSEFAGGRVRVRVQALGESGEPLDFLEMPATVYLPSGAPLDLRLTQTGPGAYEGEAATGERGTFVTIVRPKQGDGTSGVAATSLAPAVVGAVSPMGPELRTLRSNGTLLEQLAKETGGRVLDLAKPEAAKLFDRAGMTPQEAASLLTRTLLIWALAVLLLDIGTRRVAWDRFVSREYGVELKEAAAQAVRDQGGRASAALAGLRQSREASPRSEPTIPTLGDQDAAALAAAARDRRRAARLQEVQSVRTGGVATSAPIEDHTQKPETGETGLAAAKRRARERFEDDA